MQVLLTQDVESLGKRGDVVNVAVGYGRNFLLPRGMAMAVKAGNVKEIEEARRRLAVAEAKRREGLAQTAEAIGKLSITIQAKANEENKLFGSVGAPELVAALKNENIAVEPSMIALEKPIKELGVFEVKVQLAPDIAGTVKVWVVGE